MAETKEKVMLDSPEAATFRTDIKGWVSRDGIFYGDKPDSERIARWAGCTHRKCEDCGADSPKSYTICEKCRTNKRDGVYAGREDKDWDAESVDVICDDDENVH